MIATTSWMMKIYHLDSGKLVCWMGYTFCFRKGTSVRKYRVCFVESDGNFIESNLVVFTLLHMEIMEKLGMI